jgi:hypothetical protein
MLDDNIDDVFVYLAYRVAINWLRYLARFATGSKGRASILWWSI